MLMQSGAHLAAGTKRCLNPLGLVTRRLDLMLCTFNCIDLEQGAMPQRSNA